MEMLIETEESLLGTRIGDHVGRPARGHKEVMHCFLEEPIVLKHGHAQQRMFSSITPPGIVFQQAVGKEQGYAEINDEIMNAASAQKPCRPLER